MKQSLALLLSISIAGSSLASWAGPATYVPKQSGVVARAFARNVLISHLSSPSMRSSASIIPVIDRVQSLDIDSQLKVMADSELRQAVFDRADRLLAAAQDEKASFNQIREAHYELLLLERHIGILMPSRDQVKLKKVLPQASKALEENQKRRVDSVASALVGTRAPLGADSVSDASRMSETKVSAVVLPSSESELQRAIQIAAREGRKVSFSGARHSQGGQVVSGDQNSVHINVMKMDHVSYDPKTKLVKVGGGALWGDIRTILDAHGKSLDVTQVPNYFSVSGTLSVNAHGHNSDSGPVASVVESMRIIKADGTIVNASRKENAELFRLVLGGYGLFGAISEATLRVRDNVVYTPKFELIDFKDFPRYHEEVFKKLSPYGHAMLSVAPLSFLKKIHVVRYEEVPGMIPALSQNTWRDEFERGVARFLTRLTVSGYIGKQLAHRWLTRYLVHLGQKFQTRNRVMNEPFTHFETGSSEEAQILQEYFIHRDKAVEFVDRSTAIIKKYFLNMEMDAVRAVKANLDSFLSYAPDNRFGVVLISNHKTEKPDFARLSAATNELIDLANEMSGKFYLPYRLVYDSTQLRASYPQIDAFFEKKREYDPNEMFSNKFYEKYGKHEVSAPTIGAPGVDLTRDFSGHYGWELSLETDSILRRKDVEKLKDRNFIFVDGLFGQALASKGYFGAMKKSLAAQGLSVSRAATNTEAMPEVNAKVIAAAIEASDKPVMLVSHSKGGLDVLELLLSRPDLRPKVKGWIAIQAPFGGSHVPDFYGKYRPLRRISRLLLRTFGGDMPTLEDMQTAVRREYLVKNDAAIKQLVKDVPILSVGTWSPASGGWNTLLKWRRDWIERVFGKKNDGLVGLEDQLLPYATHVRIPNMDHADPVMWGIFSKTDRRRLIAALLMTLGL